ncbi:MAG: MFS transporter [Chloroflexi bacterium]|nr:MFS transporter [Chloroflexota bacterium]MCI0646863.1 MFS transporter [Chloroflexota bacterium]MCI0725856.1 MFS transporter [Chloroflexota bacterium]
MPSTVDHSPARRIAAALFVSQSLFSAAIIASFTLSPIVAARLGGSDSVAGLPSTLTLVGRAALAYPIGWLMNQLGRRLTLSLGYLVGVVGAIITAWAIVAGSFPGFLLGALLMGGARASADQSRYVAAEVVPAGQRARVIGLIVSAGTIGAIGGPLLVDPSSRLVERWEGVDPMVGPFAASVGLILVALLAIFFFLRPDPLALGRQIAASEPAGAGRPAGDAPARPLRQIFGQPLVQLATASMLVGQLAMSLVMVITSLHMSAHDHSTQAISWVIMAHTLGMFGLSGVTGWLIDRFGRLAMIFAGTMVLAVACLLAPISTAVPLLALALFLLGWGWNLCFVAGSSLLSDQLTMSERAQSQGASEILVSLGAGAGSLGSGALYARGDMLLVSLVGLAVTLALFGLALWLAMPRRVVGVEVEIGD